MRRAALVFLFACGHGTANSGDSIAVAPKPVVAKPIEVIGDGNANDGGDVPHFEIAIGSTAFCARIDGKVWCGRGTDEEPIVSGTPIGGIEDATSIAVASDYACLTTRRGTVHCWGSNHLGQLAAGLAEERSSDPVQVIGITNARRVFAGDEHACTILADGRLMCWGLNTSGETGGSTSWSFAARDLVVATVVPGVKDVVGVALSYRATCALTAKRDVWCWGSSLTNAQQNTQGHQNEQPFRITQLAKSEDLSSASGAFCAVRGGDVVCIGSTYALARRGTGGGGSGDDDATVKIELKNAAKIAVGGSHACALGRDGRVTCWGYNSSGELGREEPYDPDHGYEPKDPGPVAGIGSAREIVASRATSCAITGAEEAYCWGMWPYGTGASAGQPKMERTPVRVRIR